MSKISLHCESCQYRFKRTIKPKLCPNCGRESVTDTSHMGAEQILRELDEMSDKLR